MEPLLEPPDLRARNQTLLYYTEAVLRNIFSQDDELGEQVDIARKNGSLFYKVRWYECPDTKHYSIFFANNLQIAGRSFQHLDNSLFADFSGLSAVEFLNSNEFKDGIKAAYIIKYPDKVRHRSCEI